MEIERYKRDETVSDPIKALASAYFTAIDEVVLDLLMRKEMNTMKETGK